jgi:outer membrane protein TolC
MRSIVLILSLVFGAATGASALTLPQAQESARQHNPELTKLRLTAESAGWKQSEALAGQLPHVDLKATHFLGAKYGRLGVEFGGTAVEFPSGFPQTDAELDASWVLFDGFGAWGGYRAGGLNAEAAQLELRHAQAHLDQAVKVRFYKALAAQLLVDVADQNIKTLEQHASLADASERAGFATRVDVLRIDSQLEEARAEKLLAEDNAVLARRDLDQALGQESGGQALEGSLPLPETGKVAASLSLDASQREDTLALRRREEALESLQSAASAGVWAPRLSLFGTEQFYKYGNFDPAILPNDSFQNSYAYGLRLSWGLYDGGADWARLQQSKASLAMAVESRRRQSLAAADEFEAAKRHYIYNTALYQARLRSVEKSEESVRLAILGVKAGAQTQAQALDAELDLFRARAGVIRAQADAAEAMAALELALGRTL